MSEIIKASVSIYITHLNTLWFWGIPGWCYITCYITSRLIDRQLGNFVSWSKEHDKTCFRNTWREIMVSKQTLLNYKMHRHHPMQRRTSFQTYLWSRHVIWIWRRYLIRLRPPHYLHTVHMIVLLTYRLVLPRPRADFTPCRHWDSKPWKITSKELLRLENYLAIVFVGRSRGSSLREKRMVAWDPVLTIWASAIWLWFC